MRPNESIIIVGAERANMHSGYRQTFTFEGPFQDNRPLDDLGRLSHYVCAIDALHMPGVFEFKPEGLARELNKAYVGFLGDVHERHAEAPNLPVVTGKWGCGAFACDKHLKAIVQWLAASQASRRMIFAKFGDSDLNLFP